MPLELSLLTNPSSVSLHRRSAPALSSVLCLIMCIMVHKAERCGKRDWQWRMRQKKWLSTSVFSSVVTSLPALLTRGLNLPALLFICKWHNPPGQPASVSLWVLHAVPLQESYNEETPAPKIQQSGDSAVLLHPWWKQSKEKGQSGATTETKDTHRNIHTDKVFKWPMILARSVDFLQLCNSVQSFVTEL